MIPNFAFINLKLIFGHNPIINLKYVKSCSNKYCIYKCCIIATHYYYLLYTLVTIDPQIVKIFGYGWLVVGGNQDYGKLRLAELAN